MPANGDTELEYIKEYWKFESHDVASKRTKLPYLKSNKRNAKSDHRRDKNVVLFLRVNEPCRFLFSIIYPLQNVLRSGLQYVLKYN